MNGIVDRGGGRGMHAVRRGVGVCVAAGAAALATGAVAQPAPLTLKSMTAQADLVFRGSVDGIEYVMSTPGGPEGTRVPYTFVTYRVAEVLRGENPGETVTLRFIGGLDKETGLVMGGSIIPRIDVGDEDLLFVRGNTKKMVPLVGATDGLFRIVGGQVYSEMGEAVTINDKGGIDVGEQYRLDEVETSKVGDEVTKIRFNPGVKELPSDAATVDAFVARVRELAGQAGPAGQFVSADPAQPVAPPDMTPAPPPAAKPGENVPAPADLPAEITPRKQ